MPYLLTSSFLSRLAEEDARQIADFNSEIISQANPDQRIVYVTRVRAEVSHEQALSKEVMLILDDSLWRRNESYYHER